MLQASEKIQEIKWLRTICLERWGVCPGLKECKDVVENALQRQQEDIQHNIDQFLSTVSIDDLKVAFKNRGYSLEIEKEYHY